jgi:peptidoglycan/xylan/chitin deacetylase (PgdA/CDA1 family)
MKISTVPRIYYAAAAAIIAAVTVNIVSPLYIFIPLAAFVALAFSAPFFPGWQMFLNTTMHGGRLKDAVALTFDDGPDPVTTPLILNMLKRHGVKAAFFVIGEKARSNPELIGRIISEGHVIGNHTMNHDVFVMLKGVKRLEYEISGCQKALEAFGVKPLAFRPPAGIVNPGLGAVLSRMGLFCVMFSSRGMDFGNRRVDNIARNVLKSLKTGDIIMLHDRAPSEATVDELMGQFEAVIKGIRERGLDFMPLEQIIGKEIMQLIKRDCRQ